MFDVHTRDAPIRHYGCFADEVTALRRADHYAGVLHLAMVVEEVMREPWLAALFPAPPTVRSLADLDGTDDVLVLHVAIGEIGHLTRDRRTAVCGQDTGWRIAAGTLRMLSGTLCPACLGGAR
jgi:hypothetical protein